MPPNHTPSLVEVAEQIQKNASQLQEFLKNGGHAQPSYDVDGIQSYPPPQHDAELFKTRQALIDSSRTMLDFALGPYERLRTVAGPDSGLAIPMSVIQQYDIARKVPLDGEMSIADIAGEVKVDARLLHRVLRLATNFHVFRETRPGVIAHTSLSAAFATVGPWIWLIRSREMQEGLNAIPEALEGWTEPLKPGTRQIPMNIGNATDKDFWELLKEQPNGMENFSAAMKAIAVGGGGSVDHTVRGFDWSALGEGPVVDVGGGIGHVSVAIAQANPSLKIVIQDLPRNEEPAKSTIPASLHSSGRVTFQSHDFFEVQPILTAKAYYLRAVLHDWRDDDCIRIIRQLIPGMERGAKLYTTDRVIAAPSEGDSEGANRVTPQNAKQAAFMDLVMFALFGAVERTLEEWQDLFRRADPRLRVTAYRQPLGADHAMLETELVE